MWRSVSRPSASLSKSTQDDLYLFSSLKYAGRLIWSRWWMYEATGCSYFHLILCVQSEKPFKKGPWNVWFFLEAVTRLSLYFPAKNFTERIGDRINSPQKDFTWFAPNFGPYHQMLSAWTYRRGCWRTVQQPVWSCRGKHPKSPR